MMHNVLVKDRLMASVKRIIWKRRLNNGKSKLGLEQWLNW
jgi:hypothetical protein